MSQTTALIEILKACLKTNGITYSDIATELNLSESSVKRLFSARDFSLSRLENICKLMDMEIGEVFQLMNEQQFELQQLTLQQEQEITKDLSLLLVTVCTLNKWSLDEIVEYYKLDEHECIQKLAHLDRLKVIELLPKNKIKNSCHLKL